MTSLAFSAIVGIALLGSISGLMIGCIGIGGVILVPALVFLAGIPIKIAIPAASLAYILSGLVATTVFARNKSVHWGMAVALCIGAAPTAFAGAWAVSAFNQLFLETCLGLLTFLSGVNSLRTQHAAEVIDPKAANGLLLTVGGVTGFLSSLTGTGGPLVLVPIMISMSVPVLTAVGLSQAIQLPIAAAATVGNVLYGKLDLALGGVLAASLTVGSWCGAKLAHSVRRPLLRRMVSVVLLLIGAFILVNVGWRLVG